MTGGSRADRCAIAVMAKAPRQGEVKTRLIPPLAPAEAAALGTAFLRDIVGNILDAGRNAAIDGCIAYSPPEAAEEFAELVPPTVRLIPSRRTGLASSLYDAANDLLADGYGSVCLVNADSPTLPTRMLIEAAGALAAPGDRVVLGPAADGGYYLIGLKQPHRRLFEDIAWSTERVLQQTVDRAAELGLDTVRLPVWYDVDDLASLRRLIDELDSADRSGYPAPHTAALLRGLGVRL